MEKIICKINMFDSLQVIYLYKDSRITTLSLSKISDLSTNIINYCKQLNIFLVHFFGSEDFLEPIIKDLRENKIKVDIN